MAEVKLNLVRTLNGLFGIDKGKDGKLVIKFDDNEFAINPKILGEVLKTAFPKGLVVNYMATERVLSIEYSYDKSVIARLFAKDGSNELKISLFGDMLNITVSMPVPFIWPEGYQMFETVTLKYEDPKLIVDTERATYLINGVQLDFAPHVELDLETLDVVMTT